MLAGSLPCCQAAFPGSVTRSMPMLVTTLAWYFTTEVTEYNKARKNAIVFSSLSKPSNGNQASCPSADRGQARRRPAIAHFRFRYTGLGGP
jgi:hypothetical protein